MRTLLALLLTATAAAAQDMPLRDWTKDGEGWKKADGPPPGRKEEAWPVKLDGKTITATVLTPNRDTLYIGFKGERYLWAYPFDKDLRPGPGQPYCSLRCPLGKGTTTDVTSLTVDAAGRVYAATPLGVQVFDPTGRLSGVLLPPAKGEMAHLGWEKESLIVWVGGQKYARKMNVK